MEQSGGQDDIADIDHRLAILREALAVAVVGPVPGTEEPGLRVDLAATLVERYEADPNPDPARAILDLTEAAGHAEHALAAWPSDTDDACFAMFTAGLARLHLFGERDDRADIDAAIGHLTALAQAVGGDQSENREDRRSALGLLGEALAARYRWAPPGDTGRDADLTGAISAWELICRESADELPDAGLELDLGALYYERHQRGVAAGGGPADFDEAIAHFRRAAGDREADPRVTARAAFCLGEALTNRVIDGDYSVGQLSEGISALSRARAEPALGDDVTLAIAAFYQGILLGTRFTAHDGGPADRRAAIEALRQALRHELPAELTEFTDLARLWLGQLLLMPFDPGEASAMFAGAHVSRALTERVQGVLAADVTQGEVDEAIRELSQISPQARADPGTGGAVAALIGSAMLARGARGMQADDLDRVIDRYSEASRLMPAGHSGTAELAAMHACALAERASRPDREEDIDPAIDALRQALTRLDGRHALRHAVLHYLGALLSRRGSLRPDPGDLAAGIGALTDALALMAEDYPARAETLGLLGAALMTGVQFDPSASQADRAIAVLEEARARPHPDPATRAAHLCCYGQALHARAIRDRAHADFAAAVEAVRQAEREVPAGHPLHPYLLLTLATMLADHHDYLGSLESLDAATYYLDELEAFLPGTGAAAFQPSGADLWSVRATRGHVRLNHAAARRDGALLDAAIADLEFALGHAPPGHPMRPRLASDLSSARLAAAARAEDMAGLLAAVDDVIAAADDVPDAHADAATLTARSGMMLVGLGATRRDLGLLDQGVARLRSVADRPGMMASERSRTGYGVGAGLLERYEVSGARADIDSAITWLEGARRDLAAEPGNPVAALLLAKLADAYHARADRARGDQRRAIDAGLAALREQAGDVLLQAGTERALAMARMAAGDAVRIASWCRAEGTTGDAARDTAQALELGRGLVLHAATTAADLAESLRGAGHDALAAEWAAENRTAAGQPLDADLPWNRLASEGTGSPAGRAAGLLPGLPGVQAPADLRHRVLLALESSGLDQALLSPPDPAQVAAVMRATGTDLVAYLVAANEHGGGFAIVIRPDGSAADLPLPRLSAWPGGPVQSCAAAQRDALAAEATGQASTAAAARDHWSRCLRTLCDWAWPAAVEPLLDAAGPAAPGRVPRLVLIPFGLLGAVPWHAAMRRHPGETARHACQLAAFSYAASARQFADAAGREVLPLSAGQVLVADPVDGNMWASWEAQALRTTYYPEAALLGRRRPWATPVSVLAALPGGELASGAALLHLSCHARTAASPAASHLRLRGDQETQAEQPLTADQVLRQAVRAPAGTPGGLVVLSACVSDLAAGDYDEALTLASAFLAAGAVGVVGTKWQVPDMRTAILMFMFHHYLRERHPPAEALRRAQAWMLDSGREVPGSMPAVLAEEVPLSDLADPIAWAGFVHQGGNHAIRSPRRTEVRDSMTPDAIDALADHWDDVVGRLGDGDRVAAEGLARDLRDAPDRATRREAALDVVEFIAPLLPADHPVRRALRSESSKYAVATGDLDARVDLLRIRLSGAILPATGAPGGDAGTSGDAGTTEPEPAEEWLLEAPSLDAAQVRELGADPDARGLIRIGRPGQGARYPEFQFNPAGQPYAVVTRINLMLDADGDPWGVADWWLGPNAWLGAIPADLIGRIGDRDLLAAAAAVLEVA